jgi:hypothetical protein
MVDADELRQQPAYLRAKRVQLWAVKLFPVSLLGGAITVLLAGTPWSAWLWFGVVGANIGVFVFGQVWRVYVFAKGLRDQVRNAPSGEGG